MPEAWPPGWPIERAISAAEVAKEFHETYEEIAPTFTYKTRSESAVPWDQVPQVNKQLMIATVVSLVERGVIAFGDAKVDAPPAGDASSAAASAPAEPGERDA